jgi:hypothetical protein
MKTSAFRWLLPALPALWLAGCAHPGPGRAFRPLFPDEGAPKGWVVRDWADLRNPPPQGALWRVEQGVLHGSEPRGAWLVSEAEYGDFELDFEFLLGERGNSGCALRSPMFGDPAFDGLELQMVDPRYYGTNLVAAELTGSLYRAVAPRVQVFKPQQWNHYQITCRGPRVKVVLNGVLIQDVNLAAQTTPTKRHNGQDAPPLKDRPRRGHLGFQELSRGGAHVQIRNARLRVLD